MANDNRNFKIRGEVLSKFGCKNTADGGLAFPVVTYQEDGSQEIQYREYSPEGEYVGEYIRGVDFFGFEQAVQSGAKRVVITRSEIEALHLESILKVHTKAGYEDNKPAVIAIPNIGTAEADLVEIMPDLDAYFKEVVFAFNNGEATQCDRVGKIATYADSIKEAALPCQSIEESRMQGADKTVFNNIMFNAEAPLPSCMSRLADFIEEALKPVEYGKSYPWDGVTELTYGQRKQELVMIGGGTGSGKCQGINTPIIMHNGDVKMVQDIVVGDELMGDDSTSRTVLSLARGNEEMFKVVPVKGETYTFNRSHILAIKVSGNRDVIDSVGKKHLAGEKSTITINDYIASSNKFKHSVKLYRTAVDYSEQKVAVPPYILGVWLGDGTTNNASITTADSAIKDEWIKWGESLGCTHRITSKDESCETIYLRTERGQCNPALDALRAAGVIGNKHVPNEYIVNSKEVRMELLAGILDTDGSLNVNNFDLTLKHKELSLQVSRIAQSLGFFSKVKECVKTIKSINFTGTYYRQTISGDTDNIPTKLRIASKRMQKKDVLVTGFSVESVGNGDYYGFEITGNRLYVLGDHTVTHNTTVMHETAAHNAVKHEWKGLLFLLEETPRESLQNLAGKVDDITYHVPGTVFDRQQFRRTAEYLDKYIQVWDASKSFGDCYEQWEAMKKEIRLQHKNIDYVGLDNLTCLTEGIDASLRNDLIAKICKESVEMAMKFDIEIIIFSHLNAPAKGSKSHENGGVVLESQFTGSRAGARYAHMMFGFERNKYAIDPSCSMIRVIKNRKYGKTGVTKTYYNSSTGRLIAFDWDDEKYGDKKVDTKAKTGNNGTQTRKKSVSNPIKSEDRLHKVNHNEWKQYQEWQDSQMNLQECSPQDL